MPKLVRTEIKWSKSDNAWVWSHPFEDWLQVSDGTKREFVKLVVARLHKLHEETNRGFTLRIRLKNGTWKDEITVPRSMDSRQSKG